MIPADSPLAVEATNIVQSDDLEAVDRLLREHPELARERIGDHVMSRTLLHAVVDFPGNRPAGTAVATKLIDAGADVDGRFAGPHTETPLHWAASNDDVPMVDTLLDAGADIEASGAVIGGGTPLADAVAFGQWKAARRLVERGASMTLWQASALGPFETVEAMVTAEDPSAEDLTRVLWCAAHGGQRDACELLIRAGGDPNWIGYNDVTPAGAAEHGHHHDLAVWLRTQERPLA